MGPQAKKQIGKGKHVVIQTIDGVVAKIPLEDYDDGGVMIMPYWATYWCKRLDSRSRLNKADRLKMRAETDATFDEFKVDPAALRAMAISGVVQVTIPFDVEDLDPERTEPSPIEYALMMPWEYLLSAATKKYRNNYPLCVVRHVDGNNSAMEPKRTAKRVDAKPSSGSPDHGGFCFLETAPGELSDVYDFSIERELVEGAFGELKPIDLPANPSIKALTGVLESSCPDVLHVTGIDSRLGAKLNKQREAKKASTAKASAPSEATTPVPINVAPCDEGKITEQDGDCKDETTAVLPVAQANDEENKKEEVLEDVETEIVDGLYFDYENLADDTDFRTTAQALTAGSRKPQLIGFNCQYSGSRLAPFCVAQGAREAIGIQNTLDDDLAERFFIRFYQYWNATHTNQWGEETSQDSLAAFIAAWDFIKPMGESIKGTGIILWFNSSVFDKRTKKEWSEPRRRSKGMIEPSLSGIETVKAQLKSDKIEHSTKRVVANSGEGHLIEDLVSVSIETLDVLTPCMLHYGESVLKKLYFLFKNLTPSEECPVECIKGIDVEVTLTVGQESYPYRTQISLGIDHPNIELTNRKLIATDENPPGGIQVPLTSGLIQSADDNVRGSLFVHIEWEGQVLKHHTYSVNIAPVNEWRLGAKDSLLQPMFVQPRDNAVKEIVKKAENYLRCIEGSFDASFCGYQTKDIEPQINAIWTALTLDFQVGYVSPPPSFNEESQRLRTPSEILSEGRGTCVDLALLVASCLEWIELYPVIINADGHTLVGCWRYADKNVYDKKKNVTIQCYTEFIEKHKKGLHEKGASVDGYPWVFTADNYATFYDLIDTRAIIPIEAVCITERKLFAKARDYARSYFGKDGLLDTKDFDPGEFESVTDVLRSRQFLQPLPLAKP